MGFDFSPKRRNWPSFHLGGFSWPWMLDEGVGLPVGAGSYDGVKHFWTARDVRGGVSSPYSNDGFPVTAGEARAMARAAWGIVQRERLRREEYDALSAGERARIGALLGDRDPKTYAKPLRPIREDFVEKAEAFAWWAFGSGGFRIH